MFDTRLFGNVLFAELDDTVRMKGDCLGLKRWQILWSKMNRTTELAITILNTTTRGISLISYHCRRS